MPDELPTPEFGFMRAAEKAIKDLQDTAVAQGNLLVKANKDAALRKIQVRILGIVSVVLIIICVLGTMQYFHTKDIAAKVQQGSVTQCMDSNHIRADSVKIWDTFVSIASGPHPTPATIAEGKAFEGFIAKVYQPQNCTTLFGTPGADPAVTNNNAG